ncbi:MAG: gfo/Idh/MocA family oxidoreductase [Chloroflexi bacterium]|nr:MAG: gfo/Idh/MocA family oxidoreductase [Chloroflexota bacterium]
MEKIKVGVIGCGNISPIYLEVAKTFDIMEIVAVADLITERSEDRAAKYQVPHVYTDEELWADPEIQIVINLTTPDAHAEVALQTVQAGKSVYNEKPLTITREDACKLLELAHAKGVRVGGAPDTFLGGGLQTCRKLIDDGWIGQPVAATAFMLCHGHESWHPAPEFYYKVGGGPMFDMGPYYLTALVSLMGPVQRVTGSARITFPERTITSQPLYGKKFAVEVPTHVAGVLDFASGAIATIVTSFDVWSAEVPRIEIYGTHGTLSVPDPNTFGGPVRVRRAGASEWSEIPLTHGYAKNSRSVGVADMAYGLRSGRPHRASGEMTNHVLEIMHAIHDASRTGCHVNLTSTCQRPAALPVGLADGQLDL